MHGLLLNNALKINDFAQHISAMSSYISLVLFGCVLLKLLNKTGNATIIHLNFNADNWQNSQMLVVPDKQEKKNPYIF